MLNLLSNSKPSSSPYRVILATFVYIWAVVAVAAQNTVLDPTFNEEGYNVTPWESYPNDQPNSILVQPDGKILVGGYAALSGVDPVIFRQQFGYAVQRYHEDGTLDTTFGDGGKVITSFSTFNDKCYGMALQPDGKIILAGTIDSLIAFEIIDSIAAQYIHLSAGIIRLNADGSLDGTFGEGGKVRIAIDSSDVTAYSVDITADQKIIVGGRLNLDMTIFVLNTDGSIAEIAGQEGIASLPFTESLAGGSIGATVGPDGNITAVSELISIGADGINGIGLVRLKPDLSFDEVLSGSGQTAFIFENAFNIQVIDLIVQPDGKTIIAASMIEEKSNNLNFVYKIFRLNNDGNLDLSFGLEGYAITPFDGIDIITDIVLQPDGKFLVTGLSFTIPATFIVVRLDSEGFIDPEFNNNQILFSNFYGPGISTAIGLQPDGKILVTGVPQEPFDAPLPSNSAFIIARYTNESGVATHAPAVVQNAGLYPNPVNEHTSFHYELLENARVTIDLCDFTGKKVATIMPPTQMTKGKYEHMLDLPTGFNSGTYILNISTDAGTCISMTLFK
jgi:uncharacterized delta-60 repeat protein